MTKLQDSSPKAISETLRIYLSKITQGWKLSVPIICCVGIGTILVFYVPPLVIAHLLNGGTYTLANSWIYIALFGGTWLLGEGLWRIAMYLIVKFEVRALHDLYADALNALLSKELSFFANRFSGTITKNILAYGRRFEMFFDTLIFDVVSNLIPAIFALVVLAFISIWLSAGLLVMMLIGVIIVKPLIKRRVMLVKAREDSGSAMAGHISDVVGNIAAVKSFGSEAREQRSHLRYVDEFTAKAARSWHYQNVPIDSIIAPIYVLTNVIGLMIIIGLGVDPATKANLFIGFSYYSTVTRFLWSFNSVYRRLEEAITEASLFTGYTLTQPMIVDKANAHALTVPHGKVVFDAVTFTHSESTGALFDGLSLTIESGQKVGIVGHSGAGKSTITSLLLRFNDIEDGQIMIDDQNIAEQTQQSLHEAISYVPQEPLLFHRTLRENIAYGDPGASDKQILYAAKQAHALEFINALPDGLDTMVGERGVKLSGGQRQRIAIARALLKDAPILVLDEATSALDSESEKMIQASLEKLMQGRTSIVIAHRLSTIAKLDRIIVLENGRILEDGTHAELLHRGGTYAKLWAHQSGGFIEE